MMLRIRQMTHGMLWASQLAAVQTQKEQDVRQKADADVHEQIDQRICRESAAQKGKHEVAPQGNAAEDRHDQIKAVACVAVKPVGKDEQRRDEQQQVEDLARAVVAPAQDGAQHPQRCQRPDGQQQAEMAVGRVVQQQEIKRPATTTTADSRKAMILYRARHGGCAVQSPGISFASLP